MESIIIEKVNDTLVEKKYLEYGDFDDSQYLGSLLGFKGPELMEFQKTFGVIKFEIQITRKKDQEPTFQVKAWTWEKDILI